MEPAAFGFGGNELKALEILVALGVGQADGADFVSGNGQEEGVGQ